MTRAPGSIHPSSLAEAELVFPSEHRAWHYDQLRKYLLNRAQHTFSAARAADLAEHYARTLRTPEDIADYNRVLDFTDQSLIALAPIERAYLNTFANEARWGTLEKATETT